MSYLDKVRANLFDQWVGKIQTDKVIELGVGDWFLDIGCGVGQFTPMYLFKWKYVVGLDPNEEYLNIARKANNKVTYIQDYGETFETPTRFDTITMNMLLEHVDDPIALLVNCRKHLSNKGRIIVQVPNSRSITRRLGVLMGLIDSTNNISEKEKEFYGHKRVYTMKTLIADCEKAGLRVIKKGGILYKPLPNEMLLKLCKEYGNEWKDKFLRALVKFGEDRPEECANLYLCALA